jgi:hypothetical protein
MRRMMKLQKLNPIMKVKKNQLKTHHKRKPLRKMKTTLMNPKKIISQKK